MRESEYSKVGSVMDRGSVGRGSSGSWVVLLMGHMGHGSSNVTHCLLWMGVHMSSSSCVLAMFYIMKMHCFGYLCDSSKFFLQKWHISTRHA
jgi:hypothetical protein